MMKNYILLLIRREEKSVVKINQMITQQKVLIDQFLVLDNF